MTKSSSRPRGTEILVFDGKEAVRFVTPSGVTAVVATSISPDLMHALKKKLERKLRGPGLLAHGRKA